MRNFYIAKGCHYSTFIPRPLLFCNKTKSRTFSATVRFDESMKYTVDEKSCVNKLFGVCFGVLGVHKYSVRFGWTYESSNESFGIWKYYYTDGKLHKEFVGYVSCGSTVDFDIKIDRLSDDTINVTFYIDHNAESPVMIHCGTSKVLWTLGQYFGGNSRAPHCMKIPTEFDWYKAKE